LQPKHNPKTIKTTSNTYYEGTDTLLDRTSLYYMLLNQGNRQNFKKTIFIILQYIKLEFGSCEF